VLHVKHGDRLPSVGIIQKLINETRAKEPRMRSVPEMGVDGIYGKNTEAAVKEVQVALGLKLANGTFDQHTWRVLADIAKWRIVDVCDLLLEGYLASKPHIQLRNDLIEQGKRKMPQSTLKQNSHRADKLLRKWSDDAQVCRQQFHRFQAQGGQPIALLKKNQVYDSIRRGMNERSRDGWKVVLLRFTGHGSPGSQGVGGSLFGAVELDLAKITMEDGDSDRDFIDAIMIGGMAMPMASFGVIELHGCRVGLRGRPRRGQPVVDGPGFVNAFANTMARPVSAGTETQYVGSAVLDVRFEGSPITAIPAGGTVEQWFAQ
jgi:hypothetical protein